MSWPSPGNRRSSGGAWAGRGTHNSDRAISSLLSIANMLSRLRGSIAPDIAAQRGGGPGLRRLIRAPPQRSEEHTSELQSLRHLVCRLLLEKKKRGKPARCDEGHVVHPLLQSGQGGRV